MSTQQTAPRFSFTFYRFIGPEGNRTTEVVRDFALADGMRALLEGSAKTLEVARERVSEWSTSKGITVNPQEPFPSEKHPGKVWLDFRFGGLVL